jgi:hypothetical protein
MYFEILDFGMRQMMKLNFIQFNLFEILYDVFLCKGNVCRLSEFKATHARESVLQAEFALNRITNTKTAFCEWIWLQISAQNTKSDPE